MEDMDVTQMLTGLGPSMTLGPTCQVCLTLQCMLRSPQKRREKTGPMMEPKSLSLPLRFGGLIGTCTVCQIPTMYNDIWVCRFV